MEFKITDATVPLDTSASTSPSAPREKQRATISPKPPLWHTKEFYLYYFLLASSVVVMVYTCTSFSQESHPNHHMYSHLLRLNWLGRRMDLSDIQYRQFRKGFPALVMVAAAYLVLSKLFNRLNSSLSNNSPQRRLHFFILPFSLVFLFALHGTSSFKILALLGLNYQLAQRYAGVPFWGPLAGWSFNILVLVANKHFEGYPLRRLHSSLKFLDEGMFKGLLPRWYISYNISILRMISFFMDFHAVKKVERLLSPPQSPSALSLSDFSLPAYLAYILYPPLYIAGPIMTFTSFITQVRSPPASITPRLILSYGLRFVFCLLNMELVLSFMYVVAIKNTEAWIGFTVNQLLQLGFWNLIIIWFKLLLPWRFFRLWALCDGIDPPENMVRCMADNYSVSNFWRSWHRSYNIWILKYIYVPMGGSQNALRATALVFTFVALWHDLSYTLLTWGWAVTLFLLPEMMARKLLPAKEKHSGKTWYRHVAALGGVFNIVLLIIANLIGFALGSDGMLYLLKQTFSTFTGFLTFVGTCGALFVWTQIMFEYREEELRQGIDRRC